MHTVSHPASHSYWHDSPLADSPAMEMESAAAEHARDMQEIQNRIQDESWALAMALAQPTPAVTPTPAPSTVPVLECECGRIIPGNIASDIYVKSPKTGLICQIDHRFAGDLPPRVRGRICIADDEGTRRAKFTLLELKGILRVYRLCCQPVKFEAGPMVSTGPHTFARRH
jgi:hypothetical protein